MQRSNKYISLILKITQCLFVFQLSWAESPSDFLSKVEELVGKTKVEKAIQLLQESIEKPENKAYVDLYRFRLAMLYFSQKNWQKAQESFQQCLLSPGNLEDYIRFYLANIHLNFQRVKEAEQEIDKLRELRPNFKLLVDSTLMLGKIDLEQGHAKQAREHFRMLERRSRGTEKYPEVIYHLALSERANLSDKNFCHWAEVLYKKYPAYEPIMNWGPNLSENNLGSVKTNCESNIVLFKERVRNLMRYGYDDKALQEIETKRKEIQESNPYLADELLVHYQLAEGEPFKALELLQKYYSIKINDVDFLNLVGTAASRSGNVQVGVGAFYQIYKLTKSSAKGRKALFQSAFMSYQFQDYDGANRKFKELIKVYPKSGFSKDAQWHLAWIRYLKGDFTNAIKLFSRLPESRSGRVGVATERVNYWTAMSFMRLGEFKRASLIFEKLAKDKSQSYYSLAAQARLHFIQQKSGTDTENNRIANKKSLSRFSLSEFVEAENTGSSDRTLASEETEEALAQSSENTSDSIGMTEAETESPDEKSISIDPVLVDSEIKTQFKDPKLLARFEKARDLMILGLNDWAKWELFEIEKKTSNREYLRSLMSEYGNIGQYHRSSYIGQVVFGKIRHQQGMDGIKFMWEYAYPQAYKDSVEKGTSQTNVSTELIWGIMRAESQYRRDAISPVGALGLMQIMPSTGRRVANLMSIKDFHSDSLLQPEAAVMIGSKYLQRLLKQFNGNWPLVAAAYNAGPHRVNNWLYSFGHLDLDEFIDHIPFIETRNYVKKVISNSWIYGGLYGDRSKIDFGLSNSVSVRVNSIATKEDWNEI